jgi:hypothetical protein
VATVGVAGGVGVVLEQVDLAADALLAETLLGAAHQPFEDALPGLVVHDQLGDRVALGGGVLGVGSHIEVEPGAVAQENVGTAAPRHHPPEQIAGDLVRRQATMAVERAGDTEFGLDAHDSPLHPIERTGCVDHTAINPAAGASPRPRIPGLAAAAGTLQPRPMGCRQRRCGVVRAASDGG